MNISLIGMMGAGKSTIGKILSTKLKNTSFIDIDDEIIKQEKITINEIFKTKGEEAFRNIESDILKNVLNNDNQIISTGGGIILKEENINLLKKKSIVIYLSAVWETLYDRVKNNTERPLLNNGNIELKIKTLLSEREPLYKKADIIISTDNKEPDHIAEEILKELENYERTAN